MDGDIIKFIVNAKKGTYAKEKPKETKLPNGRIQMEFSGDKYSYRDRFGIYFDPNKLEKFNGSEVVCKDGKRKWKMNYRGGMMSKDISNARTFRFLKMAMSRVKEDRPFRGPKHFKKGKFEYIDQSKGTPDKFEGVEKVFYNGKLVHIVRYKGGKI